MYHLGMLLPVKTILSVLFPLSPASSLCSLCLFFPFCQTPDFLKCFKERLIHLYCTHVVSATLASAGRGWQRVRTVVLGPVPILLSARETHDLAEGDTRDKKPLKQ